MFVPQRQDPSTVGTFIFLMWGLIVWGLQFTALYIGHTWVCALNLPEAANGYLAVGLTLLAVCLILPVAVAPGNAAKAVALRPECRDDSHLVRIARVIAILSVVAALWTGTTAAIVQACALGR